MRQPHHKSCCPGCSRSRASETEFSEFSADVRTDVDISLKNSIDVPYVTSDSSESHDNVQSCLNVAEDSMNSPI